MPTEEEEIIIRNGTLWQWLTYTVVFGGAPDTTAAPYNRYRLVGGKRVKAYWLVLAVFVIGWLIG